MGSLSHKIALLALYQAFWDIAVDISWVEDQQGPALFLTAAVPLQAGWQLRHEHPMQGVPFEGILLDWGLRAAAHVMHGVPLLHASPHWWAHECCLISSADLSASTHTGQLGQRGGLHCKESKPPPGCLDSPSHEQAGR